MSDRVVTDPEQCRAALRQVLDSQTFARSEQSRNFLTYVCEKTAAGQADEIKEYSIGVEALGRHPDYSPADDSSVRRRAYEIRQRLEEFYASEMPEARIRIELPKGSYVPVFVEKEAPAFRVEIPGREAAAPASRVGRVGLTIAFALGGLAVGGSLLGWHALSSGGQPSVAPLVREFWGPILAPGSRTLICLGSTLYLTVRAAPFVTSKNEPTFAAPAELHPVFGETRPLLPGARLYMMPADNVAPLGVIAGVAIATGAMRLTGTGYQILPERMAPLASFRGRNVILFGDALSSQAAAKEHERAYLTVAYDESGTRLVIRDRRRPGTDAPAFRRKEESSSGAGEAYGLVTVLPTDQSSPTRERTFVISGISNAGVHGAMEFLASPERLQNLKERFLRQGLRGIPAAYQVVVRCSTASAVLVSYEYAGHEVIDDKVVVGLR
jgi:hypothetical protein